MAITVSEFTAATGTGTSLQVTKTCTAGSAIVVVGSTTEGAGAALTCTGYTQRQAINHSSSGIKSYMWTADNIAGGSTTITMGGLAGYNGTLQAFEVLGVDAAAYETSDSITQSVTSVYHAGASGLTISSNGLALAVLVADRDIVGLSVSGYSSGANANNGVTYVYSRYQVFGSGASGERAAGTLTSNGHTAGLLVALKAAASDPIITANQGSYSITGQTSTSLKVARVLSAAQGSYSLSGQAATLTYEQPGVTIMPAAYGTYAITGSDGLVQRAMNAVYGTYTINGRNASLRGPGDVLQGNTQKTLSMAMSMGL